MTNTEVILVDKFDNEIGTAEKIAAHKSGQLHRAFSIFILRESETGYETLLQKRSEAKYHSGGLWSNSCCSHPMPNESTADAAHRRCIEEIGIGAKMSHCGHFIYKSHLDNAMIEHELDHVFYAITQDSAVTVNPDEASEVKWMPISYLKQELSQCPQKYSSWLKAALALLPDAILENKTATNIAE
jgi:isopentenyl-diphosphate Delta-isomerase